MNVLGMRGEGRRSAVLSDSSNDMVTNEDDTFGQLESCVSFEVKIYILRAGVFGIEMGRMSCREGDWWKIWWLEACGPALDLAVQC